MDLKLPKVFIINIIDLIKQKEGNGYVYTELQMNGKENGDPMSSIPKNLASMIYLKTIDFSNNNITDITLCI